MWGRGAHPPPALHSADSLQLASEERLSFTVQCLNLAVQCLQLRTSNAGGEVSIPSRGTKILHVTTKTQGNHMHVHAYLYFKKKEKEELNKLNVKVLSLKEKKGKKPCAS